MFSIFNRIVWSVTEDFSDICLDIAHLVSAEPIPQLLCVSLLFDIEFSFIETEKTLNKTKYQFA